MEERAKRPGTLARCLSFAGARRGLVVASLLLAALSAAASFIPFVAIYFVIADVVAAYPNLAALDAGALASCGLLAVAAWQPTWGCTWQRSSARTPRRSIRSTA